jgi:CubicO group peptidase (beta-lactamase class C family)
MGWRGLLLGFGLSLVRAATWADASLILENAIVNHTFPGCVALVGNASGILFQQAFGNYTYGALPPYLPQPPPPRSPPMQLRTMFDMASCTKIVSTNTAIALLYQMGLLNLDTLVSAPELLGASFAQNGKAAVTVRHCLLHNAGFPPDPNPEFWDPSFGCKISSQLSFDCGGKIFAGLLATPTVRPVNVQYVYSDLSFITLMYVVGQVVMSQSLVPATALLPACGSSTEKGTLLQCYYEAFVRTKVFFPLEMHDTQFLPSQALWGNCAPAENRTSMLEVCFQGQVSDGNAYVLGGIAGHAGLFTHVQDLSLFMHDVMFTNRLLNATTVRLFSTEYNHTQSSRALGWNTNDPDAYDQGWDLSCGTMSARTFMHTGYTGTMVCMDPELGYYVVLLTNRVYPTDAAGSGQIHLIRQNFTTKVREVLQL